MVRQAVHVSLRVLPRYQFETMCIRVEEGKGERNEKLDEGPQLSLSNNPSTKSYGSEYPRFRGWPAGLYSAPAFLKWSQENVVWAVLVAVVSMSAEV
jgi:hypothetical protein